MSNRSSTFIEKDHAFKDSCRNEKKLDNSCDVNDHPQHPNSNGLHYQVSMCLLGDLALHLQLNKELMLIYKPS